MECKILIKMNSAAFDDVNGDELARILRYIAKTCEGMDFRQYTDPYDRIMRLKDFNGNNVGTFSVSGS